MRIVKFGFTLISSNTAQLSILAGFVHIAFFEAQPVVECKEELLTESWADSTPIEIELLLRDGRAVKGLLLRDGRA